MSDTGVIAPIDYRGFVRADDGTYVNVLNVVSVSAGETEVSLNTVVGSYVVSNLSLDEVMKLIAKEKHAPPVVPPGQDKKK